MIRAQYLSTPHQILPSSPRKRKRDVVEEVGESVLEPLLPKDERPPPSKRPHSLEAGFSQLSLTSTPPTSHAEVPLWSPEHVTTPSAYEGAVLPTYQGPQVVDSPIVEMEDGSPEAALPETNDGGLEDTRDVDMRRSTWYEKAKDCIVILDLDSDDEDTPPSSPPREFTISSALLSRLPKPAAEVPPPPPAAGQLVLYRPPPWKDREEVEVRNRNVDEQDIVPSKASEPESAEMEIE